MGTIPIGVAMGLTLTWDVFKSLCINYTTFKRKD